MKSAQWLDEERQAPHRVLSSLDYQLLLFRSETEAQGLDSLDGILFLRD